MIKIEEIIEDFDRDYNKIENKFERYLEELEKFKRKFPLQSLIRKIEANKISEIYQKGKKGNSSYIRKICKENLMGTTVGQVFTNFSTNFKGKKIQEFKNFLSDLDKIDENDFYNSYYNIIIKKGYFKPDSLKFMEIILIQIISCYYLDYFLPIYKIKNLEIFEKEIKKALNANLFDKEIDKLVDINDQGGKLLNLNNKLIQYKSNFEKMKDWDNITFTHFLFTCLPLEMVDLLRKLNIKYIDPNEQLVVTLFSKTHKLLGYPFITRIKTSYPDAEVIDKNGNIKSIEFEFESESFKTHLENLDICDIIVCWNDNIKKGKNLKIEHIRDTKFGKIKELNYKDKNHKEKIKKIEIIAFKDILKSKVLNKLV